MAGYSILSLIDLINSKGETFSKKVLSSFSCPLNIDVEKFLTKGSAIEFAKQGLSQTFLVYASFKKEQVLCGYFTICAKYICISHSNVSKTLGRRLRKFSNSDVPGTYVITSPLIAQLGKNFTNNYGGLITGDELLKLAIDKIKDAEQILGGKIVYVECEDKEKLKSFYSDNGFVEFGKRNLDADERTQMCGKYLIQLLKYIN